MFIVQFDFFMNCLVKSWLIDLFFSYGSHTRCFISSCAWLFLAVYYSLPLNYICGDALKSRINVPSSREDLYLTLSGALRTLLAWDYLKQVSNFFPLFPQHQGSLPCSPLEVELGRGKFVSESPLPQGYSPLVSQFNVGRIFLLTRFLNLGGHGPKLQSPLPVLEGCQNQRQSLSSWVCMGSRISGFPAVS